MKKLFLLGLILLSVTPVYAQNLDNNSRRGLLRKKKMMHRPANCPDFYVSLSTGFNNNSDLMGVSVDVPVKKFYSVEGGLGVGLWGLRAYGGAKYYLKKCQRGFAFGGGITYNNGRQDFSTKLETINNKNENVDLTLYARTNVFAAVYYYGYIGKKNNRIYGELGWSQVVMSKDFLQTSGDPLNAASINLVNLLAPGGPIVGIGFSFGINN